MACKYEISFTLNFGKEECFHSLQKNMTFISSLMNNRNNVEFKITHKHISVNSFL